MRRWPARLEQLLRARRPQPGRLLLSGGGFAAALLSIGALGGEVLPDPPGKHLATVEDPEVATRSGDRRSEIHGYAVVTVSYVARATGFREQRLDVCWALFAVDRANGLPPETHSQGCMTAITPDADEQSFVGEVPVRVPRRVGAWVVRLVICHGGRPLARAETGAFRVVDADASRVAGGHPGSAGEVIAGTLGRRRQRHIVPRGRPPSLALMLRGVETDASTATPPARLQPLSG